MQSVAHGEYDRVWGVEYLYGPQLPQWPEQLLLLLPALRTHVHYLQYSQPKIRTTNVHQTLPRSRQQAIPLLQGSQPQLVPWGAAQQQQSRRAPKPSLGVGRALQGAELRIRCKHT